MLVSTQLLPIFNQKQQGYLRLRSPGENTQSQVQVRMQQFFSRARTGKVFRKKTFSRNFDNSKESEEFFFDNNISKKFFFHFFCFQLNWGILMNQQNLGHVSEEWEKMRIKERKRERVHVRACVSASWCKMLVRERQREREGTAESKRHEWETERVCECVGVCLWVCGCVSVCEC